jgi:hypothetical protein
MHSSHALTSLIFSVLLILCTDTAAFSIANNNSLHHVINFTQNYFFFSIKALLKGLNSLVLLPPRNQKVKPLVGLPARGPRVWTPSPKIFAPIRPVQAPARSKLQPGPSSSPVQASASPSSSPVKAPALHGL